MKILKADFNKHTTKVYGFNAVKNTLAIDVNGYQAKFEIEIDDEEMLQIMNSTFITKAEKLKLLDARVGRVLVTEEIIPFADNDWQRV